MNRFRPNIHISASDIIIHLAFGEADSLVSVDSLVDVTALGDVVGVEILDARRQFHGATISTHQSSEYPRWGYDPEVDALYVHIAVGSGQRQKKRRIRAGVDSDGQLVELRVPLQE